MAIERDPRLDPMPGDMLRKSGYEFWPVGIAPSGMVAFHRFPDEPGALGSRFLASLEVWRRDMADAELVNCADTRKSDRRELDYTELVAQIRAVPDTWLPALFVTIVQECEAKKAFREGGMESMMAKAKGGKRG